MPPPTARKPRPSDKPKSVQLFKVMKELNVAADTVVETLSSRGYALDAKLKARDINAKLTPEMYATVLDAFAEDAATKARVQELRAQLEAERAAEVGEEEPAPKKAAAKAASPKKTAVSEPESAPTPVVEAPRPEVEAPPPVEEPVLSTPVEVPPSEPVTEPVTEPVPETVETPEAASERAPTPVAEPETTPVAEAETPAPPPPVVPEEEGGDGVLRADRYTLTGTKVVGSVDLAGLGDGERKKRKRKGKREVAVSDEPAAPMPVVPLEEPGAAGRRKRGGKARRPNVDQAEVEQKVQETLQALGQGTSRKRQKMRRARRDERAAEREAEAERVAAEAGTLRVMEFISTGDLAEAMGVAVTEVIAKGFGLGMMVSINQRLDADTITLLADEFGYDVQFIGDDEEDLVLIEEDNPEAQVARSPVVTIMGHVDHGKTSLLDYIRSANVVAGEAGGITQHIGAYAVTLDGERQITFLDTPGHEAFTAMRARGAQVTDLVILVVAADDQVMPQTIEAINHAKAAEVPIVVAINKMDRPEANPDRIMQQLSEHGVLVEPYGGQVQTSFVSAKTGDGVPDLLDKVLVEAELLDLKADPAREAVGTVIESRLDKGRGVVATVLVQTGTLRVGDVFVAGSQAGRVRAMFDEREHRVEEAGPSTPVQLLGFAGAPEVGDRLVVLEDEREARELAARRAQLQREQTMHQRRHVSLDDLSRRMALGQLTNLNLIVKGDVGGSVEALSDALLKLANDEVAVQIVHSGVGAITESDVMLAATSDAIIIGFQVRPNVSARQVAEREEIDIRLYSVIYDAIEEVRDALEGLLSPEQTEKVTATVEVRETFRVPRVGTIAGCYVLDGKIRRSDRIRLIRDGVVVYQGQISSLKRFKDDVREVAAGYECGLSIEGFNDVKVGDHVEAFEIVETKRQLTV